MDAKDLQTLKDQMNALFHDVSTTSEYRLFMIQIWGALPHVFKQELLTALIDTDIAVRSSVIRVWSQNPTEHGEELRTAFNDEVAHLRGRVVNIWGSHREEFLTELHMAAKDPNQKVREAANQFLSS